MGLENIVNCMKGLFNEQRKLGKQNKDNKEGLLKDLKNYAHSGDVDDSEYFMRRVLPAYGEWMNKHDFEELKKEGENLLQFSYINCIENQLAQADEHAYNGSVPGTEKCIELALTYAAKKGLETYDIEKEKIPNILKKAYENGTYVQIDLGWEYALRGNVSRAEKCVEKIIDYSSMLDIETEEEKKILQTAYERGTQEEIKKARDKANKGSVDSVKESLQKIKQYSNLVGIEINDVELKGIEKDAYRNSSKNRNPTCITKGIYNCH